MPSGVATTPTTMTLDFLTMRRCVVRSVAIKGSADDVAGSWSTATGARGESSSGFASACASRWDVPRVSRRHRAGSDDQALSQVHALGSRQVSRCESDPQEYPSRSQGCHALGPLLRSRSPKAGRRSLTEAPGAVTARRGAPVRRRSRRGPGCPSLRRSWGTGRPSGGAPGTGGRKGRGGIMPRPDA